MPGNTDERWLPVGFRFDPTRASVRWMRLDAERLSEPFFDQMIARLSHSRPAAEVRVTGVSELTAAAGALPLVRPAGVIFHISRSGATLLGNALRAGAGVTLLSEAEPVGIFFRPDVFKRSPFPVEGWQEARRMLLDCVTTLYGHCDSSRESKLVIKCHAASILQIGLIRAVWPDVPCVIVIRDPLQVLLSNLATATRWSKSRTRPQLAARLFGWRPSQVQSMSAEEYCARGLGRFCEAARTAVDEKCRVIDFEHLDVDHMIKIGDFFGLKLKPSATDLRRKSLPEVPVRAAAADGVHDSGLPSESARTSTRKLAQSAYDALRALETW